MIYAFVRVMVSRRSEATGRSLSECYREVIEAVRSCKFQHPGDRPACRVCLSPKTTTVNTSKADGMTYRIHKCQNCGWNFQTFQEIDPVDLPVREPPKVTTKPLEKIIIDVEGPRKRPSRKRKR